MKNATQTSASACQRRGSGCGGRSTPPTAVSVAEYSVSVVEGELLVTRRAQHVPRCRTGSSVPSPTSFPRAPTGTSGARAARGRSRLLRGVRAARPGPRRSRARTPRSARAPPPRCRRSASCRCARATRGTGQVVEQHARLVLLRIEPREAQEPPPVVAGLDHLRMQQQAAPRRPTRRAPPRRRRSRARSAGAGAPRGGGLHRARTPRRASTRPTARRSRCGRSPRTRTDRRRPRAELCREVVQLSGEVLFGDVEVELPLAVGQPLVHSLVSASTR